MCGSKGLRDCDDGFLLSYDFMAISERKPESLSSFFEGGVDGLFCHTIFSMLQVKQTKYNSGIKVRTSVIAPNGDGENRTDFLFPKETIMT